MGDTVFNSAERSDASPASYSETTFAFLNRASGGYWQRVRDLNGSPWRQATPEASAGTISFKDGAISASKFLGLPDDWPGPDEPFVH